MEDDPIEPASPTSPPENEGSFDNGNQQNEDFTPPYSDSFFHGKIVGYRPKENPNQFTIALDDGRTAPIVDLPNSENASVVSVLSMSTWQTTESQS